MYQIIYLVLFSFIYSAPVTESVARKVADLVIIERFNNSSQYSFSILDVEIIQENHKDIMFLFHIDPIGFVLVPADNRASPILAYSDHSNFSLNDIPENVAYLFNQYRSKLFQLININSLPKQKISNEWLKYIRYEDLKVNLNSVKPLLISEFDQGLGWNKFCPLDPQGPGGHALVGCLAVSMAQIMHYWSFPSSGEGSHSYESNIYGNLEANFSSAFYNYEDMGDGKVATDAAALLLNHVGIAIEMDYGPDVSVAYYQNAFNAFFTNFFFQELNDDWDNSDWIRSGWIDVPWADFSEQDYTNLLKQELDSFRPVFYYGNVPGESIGHCWNIDGYQDNEFHMNWGWGGNYNGYYRLNDAAIDYTDGQGYFRNVQPLDVDKPKLLLESFNFYDSFGDMDSVINPGENIELTTSFFIPPVFLNADSILIELDSNEDGISFINNIQKFGELLAGDTLNNILSPFLIEIDPNIILGKKDIAIHTTAFSNEANYTKTYNIEIDISLWQKGFPVDFQFKKSNPLVVDFNNNGFKEIIAGNQHGKIKLFNADGSEIVDDIFPYDIGGEIWGSIASDDLDNDGLIDIVVPSKSKHLFILDKQGLKQKYNAGYYLLGTPAIGNLDEDNEKEIVFASYGGGAGSGNVLWAINHDSTIVEGFPVNLTDYGKVKAGVALADFNGNNKDDIVLGTDDGNLVLFYDNGELADGFPFFAGDKIQESPSIIDVNNNKIIYFGSHDGYIYSVDQNGELVFSIETGGKVNTSPAILLHQQKYYIFIASEDGFIYSFDIQGNSMHGWPVFIGENDHITNSVVFSDLNADQIAEVITFSDDGKCLVFDINGNLLPHFSFSNNTAFVTAPIIMDLDFDDDLEIIGGSTNYLSVFDNKELYSTLFNKSYWQMYRGNNQRNGYKPGNECTSNFDACGVCGGDGSECLNAIDKFLPKQITIQSIYPNPFNPITSISFTISRLSNVEASIYDINGKYLETLVNSDLYPGQHIVKWDASKYSSGLYFIKLSNDFNSISEKVILIK